MHSDGSEDNFEINSSIQKKTVCLRLLLELSVVLA